MIQIGDSHWQWHVDQLTAIYEDVVRQAVEWDEAPRWEDADALVEVRRQAFLGDGDWSGSEEAWTAACREARSRTKVTPLRTARRDA